MRLRNSLKRSEIEKWIKWVGLDFIVGLFSISLIAFSLVEIYFYSTIRQNVFKYLLIGDETGNLNTNLNPFLHLVLGFMILLLVLLFKKKILP